MPSFRPIPEAINTPLHRLAEFLSQILFPVSTNEFTVKDSFAPPKETTETDSYYFIGNCNVESLCTNTLLKETIENCVNGLLLNKPKIDNLTKSDEYDLLYKQLFFL